jgi:hypothetical protein
MCGGKVGWNLRALARVPRARQEHDVAPTDRTAYGRHDFKGYIMSQLEEAKIRLSAALDRLETALTPLTDAQKRHARDAAEIATLNQDREGLLARIAALEEENRLLANLAEEVEGRVDRAIADINAALAPSGLEA